MSRTVASPINKTFAFLANPAPVAPVQVVLPLPGTQPTTRRRSNSAIIAWAALVQPGSPAPRSPHRRGSSCSRRPSIVFRRPSIGSSFVIVNPTTPTTPSVKQVDLTKLGYSSVFIHCPITPSTPSPFLQKADNYDHIPVPPVPISPPPPKARKGLRHFRSLSALTRSRSKSVSSDMPSTPKSSTRAQFFAVSIAKRKKAQYKYVRPAPLANELAMMQFTDGGSLESHAKRVMAHQAKLTGPNAGVGDVFRDGNGGMWWDEDEEWEYAHLLGGEERLEGNGEWIRFDEQEKENNVSSIAGEERRGSVSTQDSDLEPRYIVQPEELADYVPLTLRRPGKSVLALPARRTAKHLTKPGYIVDAAFGAVTSPANTKTKKAGPRRRPTPLKLVGRPYARAPKTADGRGSFLASSFTPAPLPASTPLPLSPVTSTMAAKAKPSTLNMRSLFRRRD
ncbi:hypothetical protein MIND_00320500 [Mycena indigotica]|uniref:Uncharacterized protein n=1 Tax=Mycena indigotica TaxID=2126181 RepID=A0A8H6W9A0_9AGAR|nr:uncharacterized protein MIND_00320500 [Mycena indigotica]KAF7309497.1 hypothetical protein MIND_00320500 [Mycena indigotica]